MIVAVVRNYGGTDEYLKYMGFNSAVGIYFDLPVGTKCIPEEEVWKVFKYVYEYGNNPNEEKVLMLSAGHSSICQSILAFDQKFDVSRILQSLQNARARFHVVFH